VFKRWPIISFMADKPYDVAISFLHRDEPLALDLQSKLSTNLKVFVYSKEQDQLAGSDGMESFRQIFREQSRLNVVLYRSGWGETRFTRIELAAIKDRCFNEGWENLLVVMLDTTDKPPVWLPEMNIRLDYSQYGLDQLIGAIKVRAEKRGSILRTEDALTPAKRAQTESAARASRELILTQQGSSAVQQERGTLVGLLQDQVALINEETPQLALSFGCGSDHVCVMATSAASINFYLYPTTPVTKSRIVLQEWRVIFSVPPKPQGMFLKRPTPIDKHEFYFDYQASRGGWCWHSEDDGALLTTAELADHIIKIMIELHERLEKERSDPDHDPWEDDDDTDEGWTRL
jgi:hypothetical protein